MLCEGLTEVVLYEGETSKKFHRELFSLPGARYCAIEGAVTDAVLDAAGRCAEELHVAAQWETITLLASWSGSAPSVGDVLDILDEPGLRDALTGASGIQDLFFLICSGGRVDLLRRICRTAKAKAESMCGEKIIVHCHLVSDEAGKIIASSL